MTTHRFLSPDWFEAVGRLTSARVGSVLDAPGMVVNATVTGVPFGNGEIELHSSHGPVVGWAPGHAADAAVSITLDYFTAKALVLDPSPGFDALSQGLANGTVVIDGERDQLRSWWTTARIGSSDAAELEDEVRALTS
jgi:hypothetical protein